MRSICEFINSRDVRKYLLEINYQFTTPEAAFVVYWSKKPVKDKIRAWEEIIRTMPDCVVQEPEDAARMEIISFHVFLRKYMELLKRDIQNFSSGEGFLYSYKVYLNGKDGVLPGWYSQEEMFFTKYHLCVEHCKKHECCKYIDKIMITKIAVNQPDGQRYKEDIIYNRNMEVTDTHFHYQNGCEARLAKVFEYMWFPIPAPFKRGDILTYFETNEISGNAREVEYDLLGSENRPFVLSYIKTWNNAEMMGHGGHGYECPYACGWHGILPAGMHEPYKAADWAMRPAGTYIRDDKGNLEYAGGLFVLYTDLEYYRKPIRGLERQLRAYSCYECGEIHEDLLINSCFVIRMEEYCREVQEDCMIYCPDEILQKIGLMS